MRPGGRRALLLGGLAVLLGTLAATDVAGREAALRARLGTPVPVIVAAHDVPSGAALGPQRLAVRRIPARYAPALSFASAAELAGQRAAVAIPRGTAIVAALVRDGASHTGPPGLQLRAGERIAELIARGDARLIVTGMHVDVLVTREHADGSGDTTLALEDAEVLSATAAPPAEGQSGDGAGRVALSLRVSVREAIALAAAQNFAREVRVLPRAPGDRRRGLQGLRSAIG